MVAIGDPDGAAELIERLDPGVDVVVGTEGLAHIATLADVAVNGVVGFAGLRVTLAALEAGRAAGPGQQGVHHRRGAAGPAGARTPGAELLPVDSEHCALHQCLRAGDPEAVARLLLTASGGPFRGRTSAELASVTIEQALAHPTWSMGPKITVDSSTLMNKGLEVIEAHELFGVPYDAIDVVVHPQSIVHSMVEFVDGAAVAQLSMPDMRLPIGYALAYPDRLPVSTAPSTGPSWPASSSRSPTGGSLPAWNWPTGPVEPAISPRRGSTRPTRWPWRPSSTGASGGRPSPRWWSARSTATTRRPPRAPTARGARSRMSSMPMPPPDGWPKRPSRDGRRREHGRPASRADPASRARAGRRPPAEKSPRRLVGELVAALAVIVALAVVTGYVDLLIVVASIIVIVMLHELGHFLVAKRSGMKVTEYFVGFGPRLWSFRRGETEYGVKALPLGGYVKIPGMTNLEEVDPADEGRALP